MKSISIKLTPKQLKEMQLIKDKQVKNTNAGEPGMALGNLIFRDKLKRNNIYNVTHATIEIGVLSQKDAKNYKRQVNYKFQELGE